MARANFGGGASDFLFSQTAGGLVRVGSGTLTFWDAEVGGTRYTDLIVGDSPASEVTVGNDGQIPSFQGPDEVYEMWATAGGARVQIEAPPVDRVIAAVAAVEAARAETADTAAEVAASAATLLELNGVAGLALDTDGIPYYDPAAVNTTTLALLSDTDGAPYYVGA